MPTMVERGALRVNTAHAGRAPARTRIVVYGSRIAMAHRKMLVDRVIVVAWRTPEEEDFRELAALAVSEHAKQGRPLLYDSVIGRNGIPMGAVRDMIPSFYTTLLTHCDSMHIVIEGTEFEQSIKRSVIASVMLQIDTRGRIFIENTLERVAMLSPPAVRPELVRAAQVAGDAKLFDFARNEEV
jgi:hypothetical protein